MVPHTARIIRSVLLCMYLLRDGQYVYGLSLAGTVTGTGRWKVSAKIQQLLNTLKRPKRRPLPEFYEDDDIELEIAANPKDPNAPKPEGSSMTSAVGEQLVVRQVYLTVMWK